MITTTLSTEQKYEIKNTVKDIQRILIDDDSIPINSAININENLKKILKVIGDK